MAPVREVGFLFLNDGGDHLEGIHLIPVGTGPASRLDVLIPAGAGIRFLVQNPSTCRFRFLGKARGAAWLSEAKDVCGGQTVRLSSLTLYAADGLLLAVPVPPQQEDPETAARLAEQLRAPRPAELLGAFMGGDGNPPQTRWSDRVIAAIDTGAAQAGSPAPTPTASPPIRPRGRPRPSPPTGATANGRNGRNGRGNPRPPVPINLDLTYTSAQARNASATVAATNGLEETAYCDVLLQEATVRECTRYRNIVHNLQTGRYAIDAPRTMTRGDSATVSFAIATGPDASELSAILGAPLSADNQGELKMGRFMAAKLDGLGFKVEPAGMIRKDLAGGGDKWEWSVTALRARKHRLTVTAYVLIELPNKNERRRPVRTLTHDVTVEVTAGQKIEDARQSSILWMKRAGEFMTSLAGLITGGVLALLTALYALRNKIRSERTETGDPLPPNEAHG